jgi:AraC-like DNA-binding protein
MYLESKVMELMALRFAEFLEDDEQFNSSTRLKSDDIDCIHQAKKLLVQNLDNPPSVLELARWVGLNRRKLSEGFRQVLGTTPFGYLRDYRLELAQQLLMNSEKSVEEIALAVGYTNRGHFAAAFRKKFGMNPKAYQLDGRKSRVW